MNYIAKEDRYDTMQYRFCGKTGLKLPVISLGLWHNFGEDRDIEISSDIIKKAFDLGITHFDLANNYGVPYGSAERNFGEIFKKSFKNYRDEIIISTKAGYDMWLGPYGIGGSRKYLMASIDQSLKRMGLEYVDIFYSHRFDPETPLEETMKALDDIVRQGKALYAGISNYNKEHTQAAVKILKEQKTPFVLNQLKYSMFVRTIEDGTIDAVKEAGAGIIAYSPLAQGLLSGRYLDDIPSDSRMASASRFLKEQDLTEEKVESIKALNELAKSRGQSLSQMALAWVLRNPVVTSALIGASSAGQLTENVKTINNMAFTSDELKDINSILQ